MAEQVIKFRKSDLSDSGWNIIIYNKTYMSGHAKSNNLTGIGWNKDRQQKLMIQQMTDGRFCIMKRVVSAHEKAGYKVYPSFEAMEEDFVLQKGLTRIHERPLEKVEAKKYLIGMGLMEDVEYSPDSLTEQVV